MTPTAVTPAARTKRQGRTATPPSRPASPHPSSPRPSHRAPLQRSVTPRAPRRVSGPAPSAVPVRRAPVRAPRPARVERPIGAPLSARALARLRTLPDHSLLDRVVRGRWWIPLLGVLLAGIVFTQVEVLKLNASIGHSVVRAEVLAGENQGLRSQISTLSDSQGIERAAVRYGMQMPAATQPLFLSTGGTATVERALRNIHAPDPAAFAAQTSSTATARANAVVYSSGQ